MVKLTIDEKGKLIGILVGSSLLRDENSRMAMLVRAGLDDIAGRVELRGSSTIVIPLLARELDDRSFACFLEAMVESLGWDSEQAQPLRRFLDKLRPSIVIDREKFIIDYNLERLVDPLCEQLQESCGGCKWFVINEPYEGGWFVMDNFFMKRMEKEIRRRTPRELDTSYQIKVTPEDLATPHGIELRLLRMASKTSLMEIFNQDKRDILLWVINNTVPNDQMSLGLMDFWKTINSMAPVNTGSQEWNLIIICINAAFTDMNGQYLLPSNFVHLVPPEKIDQPKLAYWVRGYLKGLDIDEQVIHYCLSRIEKENGGVVGTYLAMDELSQDIVKEYKWRTSL